ncbi:DoxX family protein [Nocardia gamkensis]|uniref:DoxX family protein n=1 Tax=Nocardia gamkensis TaxID=352869 RepID=UPI003400794A
MPTALDIQGPIRTDNREVAMTATTILAALLAIVLLGAGATMTLAVTFQRDTATHLGFSVNAFRRIGVLELLGAIGVLLGLTIPGRSSPPFDPRMKNSGRGRWYRP